MFNTSNMKKFHFKNFTEASKQDLNTQHVLSNRIAAKLWVPMQGGSQTKYLKDIILYFKKRKKNIVSLLNIILSPAKLRPVTTNQPDATNITRNRIIISNSSVKHSASYGC